jgi:hypothetical protein
MRVLQASEAICFPRRAQGHFERNGSSGECFLVRQVNAGKGTAAQFFQKGEPKKRFANLREMGRLSADELHAICRERLREFATARWWGSCWLQ